MNNGLVFGEHITSSLDVIIEQIRSMQLPIEIYDYNYYNKHVGSWVWHENK
jgi:hypothetical protein